MTTKTPKKTSKKTEDVVSEDTANIETPVVDQATDSEGDVKAKPKAKPKARKTKAAASKTKTSKESKESEIEDVEGNVEATETPKTEETLEKKSKPKRRSSKKSESKKDKSDTEGSKKPTAKKPVETPTKKMLIDTTHDEETRVAVIKKDNRLDDFDFENKVRSSLRGNIYLVKVTRVEPSLQAAFVDFGGNRHGFLPFPEIHPDYYRIPIADREALIAAQHTSDDESAEDENDDERAAGSKVKMVDEASVANETGADTGVEVVGGEEDAEDEAPVFKRSNLKSRYKIQEVIKRNQIMLIQVSKEERGNKGAAVSSYISLPGRYCVLMPNSPRGGGISRKVNNQKDRTRLKKTMAELNIPEGMSVIIRTAGISRTKAEIKRDFEYLMRLWGQIRDLTMKSTAPQLVHEEGDLVKRAIRDLYRKDIAEIVVEGEQGYKRARDFMKMLMPSHVKNVKQYKDDKGVPLFFRHHVEKQIDEIYSINVRLASGGYIVINPTEALVSIDVNSGKATKGRHIEETAVRTNIEAAEEVARQLRLRDMGGLVVIDFIDMDDHKNNRLVEKHLKDAMQRDRARIQIGRISAFGLLELSRQRLRPSLVETSFEVCEHCYGIGVVRTVETAAAVALRAMEEEGLHGRADKIQVNVNIEVALYIFNHKRDMLSKMEETYGLTIVLEADPKMIKSEHNISILVPRANPTPLIDMSVQKFMTSAGDVVYADGEGGNTRRRRRKRGGRRRNKNRNADGENQAQNQNASSENAHSETVAQSSDVNAKADKNTGSSKEGTKNASGKNKSRRTRSKHKGAKADTSSVVSIVDDRSADKDTSKNRPKKDVVDVEIKTPDTKPVETTPPANSQSAIEQANKQAAKKREKDAEAAKESAEKKPKKKGWWQL